MHCAAHKTESRQVRIGYASRERFLDEVEACFFSLFMKLTYYVCENCISCTITLIDSAV